MTKRLAEWLFYNKEYTIQTEKINKDTENTDHTIRKQCIKWYMIPDVLKIYL